MMNRTKGALVAVAAVATLAGCGASAQTAPADKPSETAQVLDAPETSEPAPKPKPKFTANERAYLSVLRDEAPIYESVPDRQLIKTGRAVCDALDSGATLDTVLLTMLDYATPAQVGAQAGSAIGAFCPEYTDMFESGGEFA